MKPSGLSALFLSKEFIDSFISSSTKGASKRDCAAKLIGCQSRLSIKEDSCNAPNFEVKFFSFYVNFREFKIFGVNSFVGFEEGRKKIEVYEIFFLLIWCKLI